MAMPEHHRFQNYLQQEPQSKPFRDIFNNLEGQIPPQINYINADQAHHPPYIPQFHVVGFAPGTDVSDGGFELQKNYDLGLMNKRPKEQEFLENNNANLLILGYAYPAFECFKTIEKHGAANAELRFWCQYWVIVAILTVFERIGDIFIS